jgi:hypothetical protein
MTVRILSPEGSVGSASIDLAPSPDVLAGLRLAVLDNGKPGAAKLMTRAAEQLVARAGIELVGVRRKRTAATPCEEELLETLSREADLVLTGTAD